MYIVYQDRSSATNYNYSQPWKNWHVQKCFQCFREATAFCQSQNLQLIRQFDQQLDEHILNDNSFNRFLQQIFQLFNFSQEIVQHSHTEYIKEQFETIFNMTISDVNALLQVFKREDDTESFAQFRTRVIDFMLEMKRFDHALLRENEGFQLCRIEFAAVNRKSPPNTSNLVTNQNYFDFQQHMNQARSLTQNQDLYSNINNSKNNKKRTRYQANLHCSVDEMCSIFGPIMESEQDQEPMRKRIRSGFVLSKAA